MGPASWGGVWMVLEQLLTRAKQTLRVAVPYDAATLLQQCEGPVSHLG